MVSRHTQEAQARVTCSNSCCVFWSNLLSNESYREFHQTHGAPFSQWIPFKSTHLNCCLIFFFLFHFFVRLLAFSAICSLSGEGEIAFILHASQTSHGPHPPPRSENLALIFKPISYCSVPSEAKSVVDTEEQLTIGFLTLVFVFKLKGNFADFPSPQFPVTTFEISEEIFHVCFGFKLSSRLFLSLSLSLCLAFTERTKAEKEGVPSTLDVVPLLSQVTGSFSLQTS